MMKMGLQTIPIGNVRTSIVKKCGKCYGNLISLLSVDLRAVSEDAACFFVKGCLKKRDFFSSLFPR